MNNIGHTSKMLPRCMQVRGARVHNLKKIDVDIPLNRITAIAGVSGSGKTTMVLESLIPALETLGEQKKLPAHVRFIDAPGISRVKLIDATPIGINVRSTVATYANVHDELRKIYARTPGAPRRACRKERKGTGLSAEPALWLLEAGKRSGKRSFVQKK